MRKLLLATVAALGVTAGISDASFAQTSDDSGQSAAPGTITVRLNGRFRTYMGVVSDSDANSFLFQNTTNGTAQEPVRYTGAGNIQGYGVRNAAGVASAPATGAVLQLNKQNNYTISNYVRLFPGFDGVAANGLKYGASVEIRQDNNSGSGGGVYGSPSQQSNQLGTLYIRREWGYVGTDQLGTVRFGTTDGPSGLFMVGNFENFNDGGWNGDANDLPAGVTQPVWPFADKGNLYATNKVVYLSPQFYGLDFGASFEPSTTGSGTAGAGSSCNGYDAENAFIVAGSSIAGAGCNRLSSTSTGDYTRRKNNAEADLRYRATFGPVGLAAYVGYIGGGKVADSGNIPQVAAAAPVTAFAQRALQYDGLNVGAGGVAVTYAGFTVGGMAQGGRVNGVWSLAPVGSAPGVAWLAGTSYTYGPVIVGASYYVYNSAGASGPTGSGFSPLVGQRRERGIAAGGTYSVAPGLALFLSYLYGDRKENGFDFLTNQQNTLAAPINGAQHNTVTSQVFTLGTSLTW